MDTEPPKNLPPLDVGNTRHKQSRGWHTYAQLNRLVGILFNKIQIFLLFVVKFTTLRRSPSSRSKKIKSTTTIAALVLTAILAGHTVSAQVAQPSGSLASLKTVPIPEPDNIGEFIRDKTAAIALGKSLFWDMQLGVDGITTCATCHFHAGADNRAKNQINPGLLNLTVNNPDGTTVDRTFTAGGPNYTLKPEDFPFHKVADPNSKQGTVSDNNDVTGSQGVFRTRFVDIVRGSAQDNVQRLPDQIFNVQGTNVRQVTGRNTPTVINAVFNFRNFWDGRAQNEFNGVNEFGSRDQKARVLKATKPFELVDEPVTLKNSSLASQAVGPLINGVETASEELVFSPASIVASEASNTIRVNDATTNRQIAVLNAEGQAISGSLNSTQSTTKQTQSSDQNLGSTEATAQRPPGSRVPPAQTLDRKGRKLGKKLLSAQLRPLGKQNVARDDSVLGRYSRVVQPGLAISYSDMIRLAFKPEWWNSNILIKVDPTNGQRTFVLRPGRRPASTSEYTLMEYNFSLFFGLAAQAYMSTLVSDDTPFDRYLAGNTSALSEQQKQGLQLFQSEKTKCINCHGGIELTNASVSSVTEEPIDRMEDTRAAFYDTGFNNTGVRPTLEDKGLGNNDPYGNPLSETRLAQRDGRIGANDPVVADGGFKVPGLRNVELTAPYFHNGGQLTLRQVVDFYNRGGDFDNGNDQDPDVRDPLGLTETEKESLVAFMRSLTDDRVRFDKAPFDHPSIRIPNGHTGNQSSVNNDGTGKAKDDYIDIPAVGRNGGRGTPNFLAS